jgi:hypothetical protein
VILLVEIAPLYQLVDLCRVDFDTDHPVFVLTPPAESPHALGYRLGARSVRWAVRFNFHRTGFGFYFGLGATLQGTETFKARYWEARGAGPPRRRARHKWLRAAAFPATPEADVNDAVAPGVCSFASRPHPPDRPSQRPKPAWLWDNFYLLERPMGRIDCPVGRSKEVALVLLPQWFGTLGRPIHPPSGAEEFSGGKYLAQASSNWLRL